MSMSKTSPHRNRRSTTIYKMDDDLEIAGVVPFGGFEEAVLFDSKAIFRLFPEAAQGEDLPEDLYIDIYIDDRGRKTISLHFTEDAPVFDFRSLESHLRSKGFLDQAVDRFGELDIVWEGPDPSYDEFATATLGIYHDPNMGWARLNLIIDREVNYRNVFEHWEFLRRQLKKIA